MAEMPGIAVITALGCAPGLGPFPAHAGVIPCRAALRLAVQAFPRLRRGDPGIIAVQLHHVDFSPPARG